MEIRGGWKNAFEQKKKRGMENLARLNHNNEGMENILRTAYPSRVLLLTDDEYASWELPAHLEARDRVRVRVRVTGSGSERDRATPSHPGGG